MDRVAFDHLILQEQLQDGQAVDGYHIYAEDRLITQGCTIGHKKMDAFPLVQTQRIRIELSNPAGRLSKVIAFHTHHENLPEVGNPETDKKRWAKIS